MSHPDNVENSQAINDDKTEMSDVIQKVGDNLKNISEIKTSDGKDKTEEIKNEPQLEENEKKSPTLTQVSSKDKKITNTRRLVPIKSQVGVKDSSKVKSDVKRKVTNKTTSASTVNQAIKGTKGQPNKKPAELETRSTLQTKIKFLEEELERYESERNRILHELDRVGEEKDNQIRELKTLLHDKQGEIEHHIVQFNRQQMVATEEADAFRKRIEDMTSQHEEREKELTERGDKLDAQLSDLNDYILHKEQTLAKISELEEILKRERTCNETIKKKLNNEIESTKKRVEEIVTERVDEIATHLEWNCLQKLSIDAKVAIEKFVELSKNYEDCELENGKLRHDNKSLSGKLYNMRIRLEIAESLLHQMLKQLSRKLHNRVDASVMTEEVRDKKRSQSES